MKLHAYREGGGGPSSTDADGLKLVEVAELFVHECLGDAEYPVNVIVEPLDDEARALGGWHAPEEPERDEEGFRLYRMFVVTPEVVTTYDTSEVDTFGPRRKS